jgi:hypothetical protein
MSQRQIKLKDDADAVKAREKLKASDILVLRKLETLLGSEDALVIERENLRKAIRKESESK